MSTKKKLTPLMKQYNQIKGKYPEALLLFRIGDFYETFGEDAVKTAKILDIVLTQRNNGSDRSELAGFPHHSLNTYLPKLVKAGERVAICDQLENPKETKTIVKRGVTELVTPGVILNDAVLSAKTNNFLCAIHFGLKIGVSFLDISTGEFFTTQGDTSYINRVLKSFNISEVLLSKSSKNEFLKVFDNSYFTTPLESWIFENNYANEKLLSQFKTVSLKGFGINNLTDGIIASGAILHYLSETQHHRLKHITRISRFSDDQFIWMDKFTIRNLELFTPNNPDSVPLIDIIDQTLTPMGGRKLKRWLAFPLKDKDAIALRHNAVHFLYKNTDQNTILRDLLKNIGDIERIASKISTHRVSPKELVYLKSGLEHLLPIKNCFNNSDFYAFSDKIKPLDNVTSLIEKTLKDDAPVLIQKGNLIKTGVSHKLDDYRNILENSKTILKEIIDKEAKKTGISSLKIGMNNVFGYYLEVRNTHKEKVPETWKRKQTLANAERYITEELKTYEEKIFSAEEQIKLIETALYMELLETLGEHIEALAHTANCVAEIDCLSNFAFISIKNNYSKPFITEGFELNITDGRHPVIEQQLPLNTAYIGNDVSLDPENQQIIIITGPNMAGKSALLRQTALIVILAQIGCFVPAESTQIGLVDKIFTRVGAGDNISKGESTFMVEMNETASILNNISTSSLVLLDEIGRGTSTYDGISIAWAIAEFLHNSPMKPKVLFATHYHELNEMEKTFSRIHNFNVSVKELPNTILFTRKLIKGGSEHSFGIYVAKMAGLPKTVVKKATILMKNLETSHGNESISKKLESTSNAAQLSVFEEKDELKEQLLALLKPLHIDRLTPMEALFKLHEMKKLIDKIN